MEKKTTATKDLYKYIDRMIEKYAPDTEDKKDLRDWLIYAIIEELHNLYIWDEDTFEVYKRMKGENNGNI